MKQRLFNTLLFIIKLSQAQNDYLSNQDLDNLLIRYAYINQKENELPEIIKNKVFESVNNFIKYFSNYPVIRHELIQNKKDKFNCHSLSKDKIDINDFYFSKISKNIFELLNSETYAFTHEELQELSKNAENLPFTLIKIKIQELLKNYDECVKIFLE